RLEAHVADRHTPAGQRGEVAPADEVLREGVIGFAEREGLIEVGICHLVILLSWLSIDVGRVLGVVSVCVRAEAGAMPSRSALVRGQRDLGGLRVLADASGAASARDPAADVAIGECRGRVDGAREESVAERAE